MSDKVVEIVSEHRNDLKVIESRKQLTEAFSEIALLIYVTNF